MARRAYRPFPNARKKAAPVPDGLVAQIRAEMERQGITRYRLAVDLGVNVASVYAWLEGSNRPADAVFQRIVEHSGGKFEAARAEFPTH